MDQPSAEKLQALTPHLDRAFQDLSKSASAGDVAAQREMIEASRDYLLFIANQQLHVAVRPRFAPSDAVQNAMVRALEKFADFRGDDQQALLGWLRQILLNEIKDAVRHANADKRDVKRENPISDDTSATGIRPMFMDADLTPSSESVAREEARQLRTALARLSTDHQEVLRLRNWEQLPFAEIANKMDRSETATKKLWARAVEALKRELE